MRSETDDTTRETDDTTDSAQPRDSGALDLFRATVRRLDDGARVDRVYGDPIETDDGAVVPVARVRYWFGGGFGSGTDEHSPEAPGMESDETGRGRESGEGWGGGGAAMASPVGALEVSDEGTRFVRFAGWKRLVLAVGVGFALGRLLGRR